MNIRHSLLALSALALPVGASAQYGWPVPPPPAPPPPQAPMPRAPVAEPWMAQPPQQAPVAEPWMARPAPNGQPWQSPIAESNKAPAL
jgi:hypothetical protein